MYTRYEVSRRHALQRYQRKLMEQQPNILYGARSHPALVAIVHDGHEAHDCALFPRLFFPIVEPYKLTGET